MADNLQAAIDRATEGVANATNLDEATQWSQIALNLLAAQRDINNNIEPIPLSSTVKDKKE